MNVVYVKDSTTLNLADGASITIHRGEHWPADSPVVAAFPDKFSADARYGLSWYGQAPAEMSEPPVEQVTSRPGERRDVRRG